MKKSELKQLIREQIQIVLKEEKQSKFDNWKLNLKSKTQSLKELMKSKGYDV